MVRFCPCPACALRCAVHISPPILFTCSCGFSRTIAGIAGPRQYLGDFANLDIRRARASVIDRVDSLLLDWVYIEASRGPTGQRLRAWSRFAAQHLRRRMEARREVTRRLDGARSSIESTRRSLVRSRASIGASQKITASWRHLLSTNVESRR